MPELSYCRRRILEVLADGERTPNDLAARLGRIPTNVVRDLQFLRADGLVTSRRAGNWVFYRAVERGAR
jgi:DNA-binding transcriptional ArsR family regulator